MGYMRHHAIIVTGSDSQTPTIEQAHEEAAAIFPYVSPLSSRAVNGYRSFFVPPDGSKEGWPESEKGDQERDSFIRWLRSCRYDDGSSPFDWVAIQYGDDYYETKIISDSDQFRRQRANRAALREE